MSPSVEQMLGHPASYFLEDFSRTMDMLDDDSRALIESTADGTPLPQRCDIRYLRADGRIVIAEMQTSEVPGGVQGVSRDVTELRRLQEHLAALALRDPLTGLANRRLLNELLEAGLSRTTRSGETLAVAFVDLDEFKSVNDTYGHDAGDTVLCETARRLVAIARGADVVARVGGDEFGVGYEPGTASADRLVERLDAALAMPIQLAGTTVTCRASIGHADTRRLGHDAGNLLTAADAAMFVVKRARAHERRTSLSATA
jgi:diguanylate cyclase (GGDEF)-like protein